MSKSNLEAAFLQAWRIYGRGFPDPVREYRFARVAIGDPPHPPARRNLRNRLAMAGLRDWTADFCWPTEALMVEIDGGQWAPGGGRHAGDADKWKRNDAVLLGWRVLHYSGEMLRQNPAAVVAQVTAALLASDD